MNLALALPLALPLPLLLPLPLARTLPLALALTLALTLTLAELAEDDFQEPALPSLTASGTRKVRVRIRLP